MATPGTCKFVGAPDRPHPETVRARHAAPVTMPAALKKIARPTGIHQKKDSRGWKIRRVAGTVSRNRHIAAVVRPAYHNRLQ